MGGSFQSFHIRLHFIKKKALKQLATPKWTSKPASYLDPWRSIRHAVVCFFAVDTCGALPYDCSALQQLP
jgi:hypothetical protein